MLGSVGQPRDGNPAAAFAMFDTDKREITYFRVAYDIAAAAKKIRDNGLPHWLADRLSRDARRCQTNESDLGVGWVERSETHQFRPVAMGFAALYPSYVLSFSAAGLVAWRDRG